MSTSPISFKAPAFRSELKPIWCPGCGDYGVVQALYRALAAVGRPPHEIAFVSGIGCSSRIPGYTTAYGFNTVHGRALPIAQGIKLASPELLVLVAGGDGDGFSIGGGHVAHAIRRNLDLTYIVMDNQIYGLTKGQLSPTSPRGLQSVTSPYGSIEDPVNPLLYVLAYGAGFVAQGTPADMSGLADVIEQAIRFPGFAFVNVQSPCVTFGAAAGNPQRRRQLLPLFPSRRQAHPLQLERRRQPARVRPLARRRGRHGCGADHGRPRLRRLPRLQPGRPARRLGLQPSGPGEPPDEPVRRTLGRVGSGLGPQAFGRKRSRTCRRDGAAAPRAARRSRTAAS